MAWYDSNWTFRKKLTIDSGDVDSNLTDFVVLVKLTAGNFDFTKAKADGTDIRFTASDGTTLLKFERENHDNVGELGYYWVKVSSVSSSVDTDIYIYYGYGSATDGADPTNVWDSDFKAVWHLKESGNGTASEFEDSTSNNHDGQGGAGAGAQTPTQVDAQIYKGQDFDGNDYISVPDHADWDWGTSDLTLSFWTKFDSVAGNQCWIGRGTSGTSYLYFAKEGGNIRFRDYDSGDIVNHSFAWSPVVGTWYRVELIRNGSDFELYINKTLLTSFSDASSFLNRSVPFEIGANTTIGYYVNGLMDETRLTVGQDRGSAWRNASYESEIDDLLTFGSEEALPNFVDIDTDIRVSAREFVDVDTDIRAKFQEYFEDVDVDIRVQKLEFEDIDTDIRVKLEEHFIDIDGDIRVSKKIYEDIDVDIRVIEQITKDIDVDIRVAEEITKDIDADIRVAIRQFVDIDTDIRVIHRPAVNNVEVSSLYFEEGFHLSTNTVAILLEVFGAVKMQFKNESGSWSALEVYSKNKDWNLSAADGEKQVFVRFTDMKGDLSDGTDVIKAIVDTTTPTSVTIEAYETAAAVTPIPSATYQSDGTPFFRWSIPIFSTPYSGFSVALDDTPDDDIDILTPNMVRNGMGITKATPMPEMTLDMAAGFYYSSLDLKETDAQVVTLDDGGAQDRIDIIYMDSVFNLLGVIKGTEAVSPVRPNTVQGAIELAEAYVPAGTVNIVNVTLTDIRQLYVEFSRYLYDELQSGQHTLRVKSVNANGLFSNLATFDIWVADSSPAMGEIKCYTTPAKIVELTNGVYQTVDNTPYFEWTPAPAEPGPIRYYYTEDGSEPDTGDSFVTSPNYTPGTYSDGITVLKVKPYDTVTANWGVLNEFVFIYGTDTFTDDTAVISGNTTLKQSLKEVQVKSISWDFDSARLCRIFQPLEFDATLPFSVGDIVSVVYGSTNATVFRGKIKQIERTINIGTEGIVYNCVGPRGDLTEDYAYVIDEDFGETAQISFDDVSISTAINQIIDKFPNIIKNVDSYPSGANVTDEFNAQTVEQVLSGLYAKTKYGWYIKPDGTLMSIDLGANDPGQAKFGIYGTTVNAISPQYNVMGSNLQFDITNRYNKAIIEGARKQERVTIFGHCLGENTKEFTDLFTGETIPKDAAFKIYKMDTKWDVVKIISTLVNYKRAMGIAAVPYRDFPPGLVLTTANTVILGMVICENNLIYASERPPTVALNAGSWRENHFYPEVGAVKILTGEENQGSLGPDNTIRFPRAVYNYWPIGVVAGTSFSPNTSYDDRMRISRAAWERKEKMNKTCASVKADAIIETTPLKVEVTVSGTASGLSKTLRIVNNSFRYSEDPDDIIDDTSQMIQYAQDKLEKYKDIDIRGTITLDTIDLSWDINMTVNLINTAQASWSTLNAKVVGITYNFDENTTDLEITTEYLK